VYAAPLILASLFTALRYRESAAGRYAPLLAGLFLGASILFRPTNALCAIPITVLLLTEHRKALNIFYFGVGSLISLLLGLAPYLRSGAIEQFYLATIRYNLDVYGSSDFRFSTLGALAAPIEWLFTLLLIGASYVILRQRRVSNLAPTVVIVMLLSLILILKVTIYWMGKYFMYQYAPLFYLGAPLIAAAMLLAFDRYRIPQWTRIALITCILLLFTFRRSPAVVLLERWTTIEEVVDKINVRYKTSNWNTYRDIQAITSYITKTTAPTDKIETCSWDNQIIWRTEREQSSRFTLIHPIGMQPSAGFTDYQEAWRAEIASTIEDRIPKLVLLATAPLSFSGFIKYRPGDVLLRIPGFSQALNRGYAYDTTIACWRVYRRKD